MKENTAIILSLILIVAALAFFGWTLYGAMFASPGSDLTVRTVQSGSVRQTRAGEPIRLSIPSLLIDAAVENVGINSKGNMASPSNYENVGWYRYGVVPGEIGSAVIDGHVDNGLGLDGVFKRLSDVRVGDEVFIYTIDGQNLRFVVTDVEEYPYEAVPVEKLFNRADASRLNLITCEGRWVKADGTYDQRLVVYTELDQSRR